LSAACGDDESTATPSTGGSSGSGGAGGSSAGAGGSGGGAAGSGGSGGSGGSAGSSGKHIYVFSGENNDLNVYDVTDNFKKKVLISGNESGGLTTIKTANGQIC